MSETDFYDDLIMDHIKNARNYRALDHANLGATGSNPLCGDELTLHLRIERGRIGDIGFQCSCCGISMASASIMSEMIGGKDTAGVRSLLRAFMAMLNRRDDSGSDVVLGGATREQRAILATVRKFPSRARCAALPWSILEKALEKGANAENVR